MSWQDDQIVSAPQGSWQDDPIVEKPRTFTDNLKRGAGLGVRAAVNGALSIPTMALDAGIGIGNLINRGTNALGLTNASPFPSASSLNNKLMTTLGLPEADTAGERVASDALGSAVGAGTLAKGADMLKSAGPPAQQAIMDMLSKSPALQAVSGLTGGAASGITRESGGGPGAQMAAGLLGGALPSAIQAGGSAAMRGLVRGGEQGRQNYANRLDTFQQAGVSPSVGQASGNRAIQSAESGLSQVSASAGIMDRAAERGAQDMGARVEQLANGLIPKANATRGGMAIERGIKSFVSRFRDEQGALYNKLDQYIPPDTIVPASNVLAKAAEIAKPIAGADNTSALIQTPRMAGILEALQKDSAATGGIPYQALKDLRSTIGAKITNPSLMDDIPTGQWKQLYGALSEDMRAAANAAGPDATKAFNRANSFTAAGHQRIEGVLDSVSGKDAAEKVFQAAVNPSEMRQGATTIGTVMKSLGPTERKTVTAAVIRRLGLANPGQQNDLGERFSSQTFLTNWNKIAPEAKAHLFYDPAVRNSLDKIAAAADMVRTGSKVFANPSGTAPAISNQMTAWTLAGSALTGRADVFAGIATGLVGANMSARLLTNPQFVKWLARTTTLPGAAIPSQVNALTRQAANWSQDDKAALDDYLSEVKRQLSGPAPQASPQ